MPSSNGAPPQSDVFWVVGHRGAPTLQVENTIASFEHAVQIDGANGLELDICVTKDEEIVLWHDFDPCDTRSRIRRWGLEPDVLYRPCVPRDSRFLRPVSDLALDELRRHYGYTTKRRNGARVEAEIPTLQQFLAWAAHRGALGLVFFDVKLPANRIDLVPPLLRRLDTLVDLVRPRFRIVLESAHRSVIQELIRLAPRYEHALDVEPHVGIVFKVHSCSAARAAIEHRLRHAMPQKPRITTLWPFRTHRRIVRADLELMRRHNARSADAPVQALCSFTINTKKEMEALIDLGVSGIQTDRPALLRDVALARGRRVDVREATL